jgi:hypothetical protein
MDRPRLTPAWTASGALLLSVPGATGLLQPRHLNWYGPVNGVDIALVVGASAALLLGIILTVTMLLGSGQMRRVAFLSVALATSAWGLHHWWVSLMGPPFEVHGAIF